MSSTALRNARLVKGGQITEGDLLIIAGTRVNGQLRHDDANLSPGPSGTAYELAR